MAIVQVQIPRNTKISGTFTVNATWNHKVTIWSKNDAVPEDPNPVYSAVISSGPGDTLNSKKFTIDSNSILTNRFLKIDFKFEKDGQWYDSNVNQPTGSINNKPITIKAQDSFPDNDDFDAKITLTW